MVKLVVGNLPPSATNQTLKELFHQYEDLQDYKLISNYGFVYLESEESAMHAVSNLNGIEYRGFQVTVGFVGDSRNKRKVPNQMEANQFASTPIVAQKRPAVEHRNPNPYNLPYNNGSNGISREYSGMQPPMIEARNPNPYNLPMSNTVKNVPRPFNSMPERRFEQQPFRECDDSMYGVPAYSNQFNMQQEQQYRAQAQYADFNDQYIPEEQYFSNIPPTKRPRMNPFMEDDGYNHGPRRPMEYSENIYRQYKSVQPNYLDGRQMQMRQIFLHPRDESMYRPRGRNVYQPSKSYM